MVTLKQSICFVGHLCVCVCFAYAPWYFNLFLHFPLSLQYYYNSHTQQYMYWDGEKHTYIPAASQSNTEGAPPSDGAAPSESLFATSGSKEKKDKPKNKTAQQVLIHRSQRSDIIISALTNISANGHNLPPIQFDT